MKSVCRCLMTSFACLLTATSLFAQGVMPAVSLGDPFPAYQSDPNLTLVNGTSCNSCAAKLDFQACCEPAKACAGGCKETIVSVACPSCAIAAKPAPCKACDITKHFHRAPAATCNTCAAAPAPCSACAAAPAAAPCSTCAPKPAPVACSPCETKRPVHHHVAAPACAPCAVAKVHAPAPCTTCTAPKAAPCSSCAPVAKACDTGCKAAPVATCDACKVNDPCKAHAHKTVHSRPILDAIKNLFGTHTSHAHAAPASCSTCAAAAQTAPAITSMPVQPTTVQPVSLSPQTATFQNESSESTAPVPAALAPYTPQTPFSTAVPVR